MIDLTTDPQMSHGFNPTIGYLMNRNVAAVQFTGQRGVTNQVPMYVLKPLLLRVRDVPADDRDQVEVTASGLIVACRQRSVSPHGNQGNDRFNVSDKSP